VQSGWDDPHAGWFDRRNSGKKRDPGNRRAIAARHHTAAVGFVIDLGQGYEVAKRSSALTKGNGVPLIAITGYGAATDRQRALATGFDDQLVKPVEVDYRVRLIASL
jgi:CheY-like chemotaxis protein